MRAICIGSAMADTIVVVVDSDIERITMHNATTSFLLMEQGRKIDAKSISHHIGGGGVNAAVSMARLGVDVATLVKIGDDADGERVMQRLHDEYVDSRAVVTDTTDETGSAVMISSHDRNATIFIGRGANRLLVDADVDRARVEGFDLVYISTLSDQSSEQYPRVVEKAAAAGAFVAANPGIRQLTRRGSTLMTILDEIDVLGLNTVESQTLMRNLPAATLATAAERAEAIDLDLPDDPPHLLDKGFYTDAGSISFLQYVLAMRMQGARGVLVTDGAAGAYLAFGDHIYYCPTLKAAVKGTAGAGDAFTSTLAAKLAQGAPPEHALRCAAVNAASVVSEIDTQTGLLTEEALDSWVSEVEADLPVLKAALPAPA